MWLQQQCTDVESKVEYDLSVSLLKDFLRLEETSRVLSKKCIKAVLGLLDKLQAKEYKLANYQRMDRKNCMDSCTTSPVESQNNAIKHGPNAVSSNMNMDRSTGKMLEGVNNRLQERRNHAFRELNHSNHSSSAPTRDFVTPHGQRLMDRFYDLRHHCKSAQIAPGVWRVWDFDEWMDEAKTERFQSPLWAHYPIFCRVRELRVNDLGSRTFIKCTCKKRVKLGIPCRCFARIIDNGSVHADEMMDMAMIDIRYWKIFHAHYGEDSKVGQYLLEAQRQCFLYEHAGIAVKQSLLSKIVGDEDSEYPILGPNTTSTDYKEMLFAWGNPGRTLVDLTRYRAGKEEDEDLSLAQLGVVAGERRKTALSDVASAMQKRLEQNESTSNDSLWNKEEKDSFMSTMIKRVKFIGEDEMGTTAMKQKFMMGVDKLYDEYVNEKNAKHGSSGGGNNTMEFAAVSRTRAPKERRKRGGEAK